MLLADDPREFALFAFGGNGPLFAAGVAAALGITRIVVPPSAGLFSSFGLLYVIAASIPFPVPVPVIR